VAPIRDRFVVLSSLCLAALVCAPLLPGCTGRSVAAGRPAAGRPDVPRFTNIAASAGVGFRQGHAGLSRPLTILEATGSGCAFLDYDGDGRLDLFLAGQPRCALYHNKGASRGPLQFRDVTLAAGLGRTGFWIGCGTGDVDNDGDVDLFVTGYQYCALYRNNGDGTFTDGTAAAGIPERGWQTSCAFGDVDRDGFLDFYVCRYLRFGPTEPQSCPYADTTLPVTCSPDVYEGQKGLFYHNQGGSVGPAGSFTEATRRFGFHTARGKAWGAAFGDVDGDGWQELYVANDEMPGDLFRNRGGRVQNQGAASGTAFNRDGAVQGGMGVDFGDCTGDGRLDLVVTTFWMEPDALYRNDGGGLFSEVSYPAGIAAPTLKRVGFGTRLADFNNDGRLDLFFLNGHVRDASLVNPDEGLPQPMQLFLNESGPLTRTQKGLPRPDGRAPRFREVSSAAGGPFRHPIVGRGAAFGDVDNDGDVDIAAIDAEGVALLLRNDGPPRPGHWLIVRALTAPRGGRGTANGGQRFRDALGARITVTAGGMTLVREVQTAGSVLSANDPRAHFGLGAAARIDRLTVRWPDGSVERRTDLAVDRILELRQR
jgi:hypothetical protein